MGGSDLGYSASMSSRSFHSRGARPMVALLLVRALTLAMLACSALANKFPDYLVIGQQRSGTSTLFALANKHPRLMYGNTGGGSKEPCFFQAPVRVMPPMNNARSFNRYGTWKERCDRTPTEYSKLWNSTPGTLVGDWSATQLSCFCCPQVLHTFAPKAKLIAILRDPVARALSRFAEQWNWPYRNPATNDKVVRQYDSFQSYADAELSNLTNCFSMADWIPGSPLVNLSRMEFLIRHRCLTASTIIGWSAYSVFLRRWLEFYPKEQLMVLYTSELEHDPLAVMRKVEKFLGIQEHTYPLPLLQKRFNTADLYGWAAWRRIITGRGLAAADEGQSEDRAQLDDNALHDDDALYDDDAQHNYIALHDDDALYDDEAQHNYIALHDDDALHDGWAAWRQIINGRGLAAADEGQSEDRARPDDGQRYGAIVSTEGPSKVVQEGHLPASTSTYRHLQASTEGQSEEVLTQFLQESSTSNRGIRRTWQQGEAAPALEVQNVSYISESSPSVKTYSVQDTGMLVPGGYVSPLEIKVGQHLVYSSKRPVQKSPSQLAGDTDRVLNFYKPFMQDMKAMADEGLIAPIPDDVLAPYL